jgi:metal-responsive CopG/Arc/MetJ family transcriptional regulator
MAGYNSGYTGVVKTAVSMPDDLFRMAEAVARKLRVSRSELYANAIAEYLKRQQDDAITQRLNEVYARCASKLDSSLHRAQVKSLEKESW